MKLVRVFDEAGRPRQGIRAGQNGKGRVNGGGIRWEGR